MINMVKSVNWKKKKDSNAKQGVKYKFGSSGIGHYSSKQTQ